MAKLPRYERQIIKTQLAPAAETTNLRAATEYSKTLQGALDQLTEYTAGEANVYAEEQATESFLDTPLTLQDYQKAARTEEDPVKQFHTGGTTYNETLTKLYANQAKVDLLSQLQLDQEAVLTKVKDGTLTDVDAIRAEMQAPIAGYSKVIYNIDAAQGAQFANQATTYSKTYLKSAMKEVSDNAEAEMQLKVGKYSQQATLNFDEYVKNENDPSLIMAHRDFLLDNATEFFKLTGKTTENLSKFTTKLDKIEKEAFAAKIAESAYLNGVSKDDLNRSMILEDTPGEDYKRYYQSLTSDKQKDLRTSINTAYSAIEITKSSNKQGITTKLNDASRRLDNLEFIDFDEIDKLKDSMDDTQLLTYDLLVEKQKINELAFEKTKSEFKNTAEEYRNKYAGEKNTQFESDIANHFKKVEEDIDKRLRNNPVQFAMQHKRYKDSIQPIMIEEFPMTEQEISSVRQKISSRKSAMAQFNQEFGVVNEEFFNDKEIQYYDDLLEDANKDELVNIITGLDVVYDDDKYDLFDKLEQKNSALGHMGSLLNANYDPPLSAQDSKQTNLKLLAEGFVIDRDTDIKYSMAPSDTKLIDEELLGADLDSVTRDSIIQSGKLIYKALNKNTPATFDSEKYIQALEFAAGKINGYGGVIEYNNSTILIPAYLTKDILEGIMDTATLDDFKNHAYTIDGEKIDNLGGYEISQFRKAQIDFPEDKDRIRLISKSKIDRNLFSPTITIPAKQFVVNDQVLTIDIRSLLKDLQDRNIDIE